MQGIFLSTKDIFQLIVTCKPILGGDRSGEAGPLAPANSLKYSPQDKAPGPAPCPLAPVPPSSTMRPLLSLSLACLAPLALSYRPLQPPGATNWTSSQDYHRKVYPRLDEEAVGEALYLTQYIGREHSTSN